MLVCGEASGDQLGGQLIAALRSTLGENVRIGGVGGRAMAAQGLKTLFPLDDTAVMGLREVVPKIPLILRRVRQVCDLALATRPDALILIDSPDFTHRIARRLKRLDPSMPTIGYVAPQVWASRAYRARAMARNFDLLLALLPFEPPFFERYGLRCRFVGHPVIERASMMTGGQELRARLGIGVSDPVLMVLPGSRSSEIRFILPILREAAQKIVERIPPLVCVLPTVPHVAGRVRESARDWPTPLHIIEGESDKFAAMNMADVALAASGTVTTELALARTPMVVAYRVGWLTYLLARPLFVAPWFTLVNLLLQKPAVPEFLQNAATPQSLADSTITLLTDESAAASQRRDLARAAELLGEGAEPPSLRAARAIVEFIEERRSLSLG